MAWILHLFPKNAANSRAISCIFMKNLNNYAHFYLVILSCKGLNLSLTMASFMTYFMVTLKK